MCVSRVCVGNAHVYVVFGVRQPVPGRNLLRFQRGFRLQQRRQHLEKVSANTRVLIDGAPASGDTL